MFELNPALNELVLRVIVAILVLVSVYFVSRYVHAHLKRALMKFGSSFANKTAEVARYFILFMGVAIAASILSLDIMAISIIIAAILLFLLVSMRDILVNLAAELYLVTRRPFKENDWIKVGEIEGTVKAIGGMDTEIITYDGDLVVVPNSYFLKHPIINKSQSLARYVELKLIFPKMKLDKLRSALEEVLKELRPELFGEPEILSINEKEKRVEAFVSLPVVNVRKLKWLAARIAKAFFSKGIEVEVE